jgi:hypothetical protein
MRGERGILIVSQDSLTRIASNPFFPYLLERIEQATGLAPPESSPTAQSMPVSGAALR